MQNKVGDNTPSAEVMEEYRQGLETVVKALKTFGITLDKDDRKRLLHARRDADPMVKRVHDLATKYKIEVPNMPLQGMINDQDLRQRMHPLTDLFRAGLVLSEDTEGQAESEMWEAFLAYYGVLASMAARNPDLAVELQPVIEFMATAKRRGPGGGGGGGAAGGGGGGG